MAAESSSSLHLPGLKITGFRGFDALTIPRLGRVTLLAGRNGAGKTTVLDAVRVLAARGRPSTLVDLLQEREELATGLDKNRGPLTVPDTAALFHGRGEARSSCLAIGPGPTGDDLRLTHSSQDEWSDSRKPLHVSGEALKVEYGDWKDYVPWSLMGDSSSWLPDFPSAPRSVRIAEAKWPSPIKCESLGPGLLSDVDLGGLWRRVALTDDEDFLVQALTLILDEQIQRMSVVDDNGGQLGSLSKRGVIVKLRDHSRPVPLKSFGDGAVRLFGAALALVSSRGGLLLIDEAENGLHHTVHEPFWRTVLQAAHAGGVQVLATTHSFDCIAGFALAATELAEIDGVLVRLEQREGRCRSVVYSEDELKVAAEQRIEVR